MSPVEGTGNKPPKPDADYENYLDEQNAEDYGVDMDAEVGYEHDYETGNTSAQKTYGYSAPQGGGTKNMGTGGVSGGGDFPGMEADPNLANQINAWKSQGYTPRQIQQKLVSMGYDSQTAHYYANGGFMAYGEDGMPNQYQQYSSGGQYGGGQNKFLSSWGGTEGGKMMKFMMDQQEMNEAKSMQRNAKKMAHESKVKIHMILLQIMMGDIVGALRSYAVLMDRDMRQFTRLIVKKLDAVRKARSTVIRNFARTKPPRAYAGQNPSQAARAQDRSSRYTQFVQMSTQLMNELQNTERELVDALQTMHRNMQTFWESYAGFRDQEFRTNERVMTMR